MFNKTKRVGRKEFELILKKGRVEHGDFLYIRYLLKERGRKFSIVVPKKMVKSAVGRHFLRRKIISILKSVEEKFPEGYFIIFTKKDILNKESSEILGDINKILSNLVQ